MGRGLMQRLFALFLCFCLMVPQARAQEEDVDAGGGADAAASSAPSGKQKKFVGPRKQLAVIILAGLGGAVLGLSTLSFYGRPQDYLASIAVGFALGIIVGTIYVTYKAATNPQEFYGNPKRTTLLDTTIPNAPPVSDGLVINYRLEF